MKHQLIKFSFLYGISAILLRIVGVVVSFSLARNLSTEVYGAWGVLYAFQTGITAFGIVGIQESVVGLLKSQNGMMEREHLYRSANSASLFTLGYATILALILGLVLIVPKYTNALGLFGVLTTGAVLAYVTLQSQIIRLEERHVASLKFSLVIPVLGLLASYFSFTLYGTIESFFLGYSISIVLGLMLFRKDVTGFATKIHDTAVRSQLLKRVTPFIGIAFFGWLSGYGNNIVIDQLFSSSEVARVTFALTIGALAQMTATALNQVWSPHFYKLIRQGFSEEYIEKRNLWFYSCQAVVIGLMASICIVMMPPLLNLLGGNLQSYASMQVEFFFILSGYIVLSPWTHCQNYFLTNDKGALMLRVVLYTSMIGLVVWVLSVLLLGTLGIYVGFFLQMLFRSIGIVLFSRRYWSLSIGWAGVAAGMVIAGTGVYVSKM